jgi:hypothetical protein
LASFKNHTINNSSLEYATNKLTAAARSTCPTAVAGFENALGREVEAAGGRGAVGMGGFADPFAETLGFTGITGGFGLAATGGGGLDPIAELGRELAGVVSTVGGFFHGVADPLEGCNPGIQIQVWTMHQRPQA